MIQGMLIAVNLLLLFIGLYHFIGKFSAAVNENLTKLTAVIVWLITTSFFYYLMLLLNQDIYFLVITLLVVNLSHIYISWRSAGLFFKAENGEINALTKIVAPAAVFLLTVYFVLRGGKYGGYDAWAIWNMHAKFLFNPETWKHLLTTDLAYSHPDYPLMLPSLVAIFWKCIDRVSTSVPVLLSYFILLLVPLSVFYGLQDKKRAYYAPIGLSILLTDSNFKLIMLSQQADALLCLLILFTFIQYHQIKTKSGSTAYLLGFISASCSWVKNEGLVFYLLFAALFLIANYKSFSFIVQYLKGAILPTLVIASYKLFLSPPNDLLLAGASHHSFAANVLDPGKYFVILKFWFNLLFDNYQVLIVLIVALLLFARRFFTSLPFLVILLLLLSYVLVYLNTPYDLPWHLLNSLNRLLMQVFPSFVFLALIWLKSADSDFKRNSVT